MLDKDERGPNRRHDLLIRAFRPEIAWSCYPVYLLQSGQARFVIVEMHKMWLYQFTLVSFLA